MLTDAVLRVDDGVKVTETILSAGQAYHRPAGVEHDVMNGADVPLVSFSPVTITRWQPEERTY